jgi:hypothetical protein
MDVRLRKPDRRRCELCDRVERWDEDVGAWRLVHRDTDTDGGDDVDEGDDAGDATLAVGRVHCLHQWDIDGTFAPIREVEGE